jgi:glycosyltransferase involved in cell wall biosynthesis
MFRRDKSGRNAGRAPVAIQLVSTGGFYGAERTLLELATFLHDHGWESRIVVLEGDGTGELMRRASERGIAVEAYVQTGRLGLVPMLRRLRASLACESRAVVHSHGYKPDILLAALGVQRRLPCVATCHSWYRETPKLKALEYLDKRAVRHFDHVVAVSEEIYNDLRTNGTPTDRLSMIANGISVPVLDARTRDEIRAEWKLAPGEKLIVQIGRLAKSKCNALLLKAVAGLSGKIAAKVILVGDGEERSALAEYARSLGVDGRVIFAGYRRDAADIMAAADVMAITSIKEGLPIVMLEAMAVGCPIIATAVGAIPQVLSPESAWVIPVEDDSALMRALQDALNEASSARARAAKARSIFHRYHARDVMGRRYLGLYERAWNARGWAGMSVDRPL